MRLAKIVEVLHPETLREKRDEESQDRMGRTIDLDKSFICEGRSAFLHCVYPDFRESLVTSRVSDLIELKYHIAIVTKNSIYILEEVAE